MFDIAQDILGNMQWSPESDGKSSGTMLNSSPAVNNRQFSLLVLDSDFIASKNIMVLAPKSQPFAVW